MHGLRRLPDGPGAQYDTDGDGIRNAADPDDDGDGDGIPETVFLRHADVAPLLSGAPAPGNGFNDADALVIVRRVRGLAAEW